MDCPKYNYWTCEHCGAKIPDGMGHGCAAERAKRKPTPDILEELSALNVATVFAHSPMETKTAQHAFNQKIIEVLVNAGIVAKNEGWNAK